LANYHLLFISGNDVFHCICKVFDTCKLEPAHLINLSIKCIAGHVYSSRHSARQKNRFVLFPD